MGIVAKAVRLAAAATLLVQPARTQMPVKGSIEGDVVDLSSGRGIAGARVRIQSGQDDPLFTTADERGHFRFSGLKRETYAVDARCPGFIAVGDSPQSMHVRPDWIVRLELHRYGVIAGKVTDALGIPAAGVSVEALQRYPIGERQYGLIYNDGAYQYVGHHQAHTDDLGEYRIAPVPAGSYYIYVQPGSTYYAQQPSMRPPRDTRERDTFYPHAGKPAETKPLEVAEGQELRADVQIVREGGVKIGGRVLGMYAAAGRHVAVFAWPLSPGASSLLSVSIPDGHRFSAADVLPGKYLIEAGEFDNGDSHLQTPWSTARRAVEVGTEDLDGIDLTLAPTPRVEGEVVFESGCSAVPVWIQLQGDRPLGRLLRSLHVGADGRFVLEHFFQDRYKAYVQPESPSPVFAASAKLGEEEVLNDGFDLTAETKGPLRITMRCARR